MIRRRNVLLAGLLITAWLSADALARKKKDPRFEALADSHKTWLETVDRLFEDGERDAFLDLGSDEERQAFIEEFWRRRDPHPETARNERREEWMHRVTLARQRFEDLSDPRSRFVLENGWPDEHYVISCPGVRYNEVWHYRPTSETRRHIPVILYPMAWEWRTWDPWQTEKMLFGRRGRPSKPPQGCNYEILVSAIYRIRELNEHRGAYAELLVLLGETALRRFVEQPHVLDPTALAEGAETFEARLAFDFAGRRQSRTRIRGQVVVPLDQVEPIDLRGIRSYNFDLYGKVLRYGTPFETFRYRFDIPERETGGEALPLHFERFLRPGEYQIVVRVEDLRSGRSFYEQRKVTVPAVAATPETPSPAVRAVELSGHGEGRLEIVEEPAEVRTDMVRVRFRSLNPRIDRVDFALDEKMIFSKRRPPFGVELDLGDLPATRELRAMAFDAEGRMIETDSLVVNPDPYRFRVELIEPVHGRSYGRGVDARARVVLPHDRRLERLELFRNDVLVAAFDQEPFRHPIELPAAPQTVLIRAVGRLDDGTTAEDVVIVNSPAGGEINVDLVELYVAVTDAQRRAVADLSASEVTLLEDGRVQTIEQFERVRDLPIRATMMIDLSASMAERLEVAREAALDFFEQTIGPDDSLALVTFSDHPAIPVGFTHELERFAEGLAGLRAEGGTALYDSLVFALFQGESLKGQRAIVLLSDGLDEGSRFTLEEGLEAARRAGIAIYAIGLDLPGGGRARRILRRFSDESGGRAFFLDGGAGLGDVYAAIRDELRSKYLLTYQSDAEPSAETFRRIEIRLARRGLEAKTVRGYYP